MYIDILIYSTLRKYYPSMVLSPKLLNQRLIYTQI